MLLSVLGEEQTLLRESAVAFLEEAGGPARARRLRVEGVDFDPDFWRRMADLGWLGLRLPESQGGLGLSLAEAAVIARELGASADPAPFVEACFLPSVLLAAAAGKEAADAIAAGLCAGDFPVATMIGSEPLPSENGRINGVAAVRGLAGHGPVLVLAAEEGQSRVILLDGAGQGLSRDAVAQPDGSTHHRVTFSDAPFAPDRILLSGADADAAWRRAMREAKVALSWQLCGLAQGLFDRTAAYIGQRVQFGQTVSSFQVVRHRMVDLHIAQGLAEAVGGQALQACTVAQDDADLSVHVALARASDLALMAARQAIQLHGAIGYTEECDVGVYVRAAMTLAASFGTASSHRHAYWNSFLTEDARRG